MLIAQKAKSIDRIVLWLFVISCIILEISSNSLYYVINNMEVYSVCLTTMLLFLCGGRLIDIKNKNVVIPFLVSCLFYFIYVTVNQNALPYITNIYYVVFTASFIFLRLPYREWIYDKFIRINSVLLALGVIEFLLSIIGINFFWGVYERGGAMYNQGIFMSVPAYIGSQSVRFMSFFNEPGYLGTLSFFVLADMNRKKYKKEYISFLVAGLLSFSLAFYVLYGLWLLIDLANAKQAIKKVVPILLLCGLIFITPFGLFFRERIMDRIESTDNLNDVDNRNTEEVNKLFNRYIDSSDALWGMGERNFYNWRYKTGNNSVGIKYIILCNGIVGLVFMFLIYTFFYLRINGRSTKTYKMLLFYWINFYQRSYWFFPPLVVILLRGESSKQIKEK